jgi:DNA polymerase III delta subunit
VARWREALLLCERCDRAIKGQLAADPWQILEDLVLTITGKAVPARASA